MPCGMRSILTRGAWSTSPRMVRPRSVMTTSRVEQAINSSITRCWSALGVRRTVWSVVTTGAANSRSRTSKWLPAGDSELVLEADDVHVAGVEEVGGAAVGFQILLLNLEAHDVGIPVAPLDVIDRKSGA